MIVKCRVKFECQKKVSDLQNQKLLNFEIVYIVQHDKSQEIVNVHCGIVESM